MADNFYAAGLKVLLAQGFWTPPEKAVLEWLHSAAEESAAIYWDNVTGIIPGSDGHVVIRNIITKCKHFGLAPVFEELQKAYDQKSTTQSQHEPEKAPGMGADQGEKAA
jgi:hypothetical protein